MKLSTAIGAAIGAAAIMAGGAAALDNIPCGGGVDTACPTNSVCSPETESCECVEGTLDCGNRCILPVVLEGDNAPPDFNLCEIDGEGEYGGGDGGGFEWPSNPSDESDSTGDPHFKTWHDIYYDFQGIGEFVQCQTDAWKIHTCQEPWIYNPTSATVNSAVAVTAGSDTFAVAFNAATLSFETTLNGDAVEVSDDARVETANLVAVAERGGVRVIIGDDSVRLGFSSRSQWINIFTKLGSGAATSGLCGNNQGDSSSDFTRPDGSVVALPTTWWQINTRAAEFGESWRVPDGSSAFTGGFTCGAPEDFPDFQSFDPVILAGAIDPSGKADGRRARAQAATPVSDFFEQNIDEAIDCIAAAAPGIDRDMVISAINAQPFGITGEQARDAVRMNQMLYDLIFFAKNNDSPNPIDLSQCASGNVVLEAFGIVVDTPDEGEETVAFCDGQSRCTDARAVSSSTRVGITWSADGDSSCR